MTPEEALDLLPLLAAGELDAQESADVRAALDGRPDVADELARWVELDGLLERSLAPSKLASVRCPFCRDGIATAERILCADCLTPHHASCFAENEGCSLLGCHGTRAVASERASVLCGACRRDAPDGARWCPWCRAKIAPPRPPLHARARLGARARSLVAFAAALLVLLPGGLAIGFLSERSLERAWWQTRGSLDTLEEQAEARRVLQAVLEAQRLYRARGVRGGNYAADPDALRAILGGIDGWRRSRHETFAVATAASLSRPDERFWVTVTRGERGFFATQEGRILPIEPDLAVDRVACALVPAGASEDAEATLQRALDDVKEKRALEAARRRKNGEKPR
jgi:hypothetical protein